MTTAAPLAAFLAPIGMISRGRNPRRRHGDMLTLLVERHQRGRLRLIAAEPRYAAGRDLDGQAWDQFPEPVSA